MPMPDRREELLQAKTGVPTARCDGILLHSLYDPMREAEQYLGSLSLPSQPHTFLVLGSCLGYLEHRLSSLYPDAKVLSLQFSSFFKGKEVHSLPPSHCWYPDSDRSVEDFLYERLEGADLQELLILSWKPAFQAYPRTAQSVSEQVLQVLREMGRSLPTTYVFGRRWILNAIKNFLFHFPPYRLPTTPHPICIAASGPSLSRNLPYLRQFRDRYVLWALPSSLFALIEFGLYPDLLIMTDGGNYAPFLLYPYLRDRNRKKPSLPLAFPLTAAFLPPRASLQPVLFHQGTGIEGQFLSFFPFPLPYVPPNGTVAGTALELALHTTTGPIVFLGLDLCVENSEEHVRPHPFEELLAGKTSRLHGAVTPWINRIWDQYPEKITPKHRTSPALQTYAGWFRTHAHRWENRVFRVSPSPVDTGMEEKPLSFLGTFPPIASYSLQYERYHLSWEERKRIVIKVLTKIQASLPTVDPYIARAFDISKVDDRSPLHPRIRIETTLARILKDLGGEL